MIIRRGPGDNADDVSIKKWDHCMSVSFFSPVAKKCRQTDGRKNR
jgi:hypothetical protein